jgi:WD40 repeat protein
MDKLKNRCLSSLYLTALLSLLLGGAVPQAATSEPAKPEPVLQVGHRQAVRAVVFSPDGRWLASGAKDGTIKIWETKSGHLLRTLYGHGSSVNALAISTDGKTLASGSGTIYDPRYRELFLKGGQVGGEHEEDTSVRLWDVSTGSELRMFTGHQLAVAAVAFSRDNRNLISVSSDAISIWDLSSGNQIHSAKLIPPPKLPKSVIGSSMRSAFNPFGNLRSPFSSSKDVWQKRFEAIFEESAADIMISSGGGLVAVALPDKKFRLIDTLEAHELRSLDLTAKPGVRSSLAFSPDAQKLAYLKNGKELALQAITSGKDLWRSLLPSGADNLVLCFTPDGSGLLVGRGAGQQSSVRLVSAVNGTELEHFTVSGDEALRLITYSRADDYLAIVPEGGHNIELRNAKSGQLLRLFETPSATITGSAADSPNIDPGLKKQLADFGLTRKGEISEAAEDVGEFSSTYRGGETVTFTADGKWLLTRRGRPGSLATVAWDAATGTQVQDTNRFREIGLPGYSPDGRFKVAPQYLKDAKGFHMFDFSQAGNEFGAYVSSLPFSKRRRDSLLFLPYNIR